MKTTKDSARRLDNQRLAERIKENMIKHGHSNFAKVLREVIFVHIGWDSDFTELDNVLRRIERDFEGSLTKDIDRSCRARRLDIPGLPDGDPADHFS